MNITFTKFGAARDEIGQSDIFVDGVQLGIIEQKVVWKDIGSVGAVYRKNVTGYLVEIDSLPSVETKTLGEARGRARELVAALSVWEALGKR